MRIFYNFSLILKDISNCCSGVTIAGLSNLSKLKGLQRLLMSNSLLTDNQLAELLHFESLIELDLSNSVNITDNAVYYLKRKKKFQFGKKNKKKN